jgi:hypothetical protein
MRIFLFLAPIVFAACGTDTKSDDSTDSGEENAEQDRADQLWLDLEGYSDWAQHTDWTGVVASEDGTHGAFVSIWMNDIAATAIAAADGADMPQGAIIVKEGYSDAAGAELGGITVMLKESGWGDDGWFWAKYPTDMSGTANLAGSPSGCTGCHTSGQDSVRFTTW